MSKGSWGEWVLPATGFCHLSGWPGSAPSPRRLGLPSPGAGSGGRAASEPSGGGGGPAVFQGRRGSSSFGGFVFESCSFPLAQAQLLGRADRKGPSCGARRLRSPPPPPRALLVSSLLWQAPPLPPGLLLGPARCPGADLAHREGSRRLSGAAGSRHTQPLWFGLGLRRAGAQPCRGSGLAWQARARESACQEARILGPLPVLCDLGHTALPL